MARKHKGLQLKDGGMDDIAEKVALGATGLALAAGAVAAGTMLASRGVRRRLQNRATKTVRGLGDMWQAGAERYQAVQHRISGSRSKKHGKRGYKTV